MTRSAKMMAAALSETDYLYSDLLDPSWLTGKKRTHAEMLTQTADLLPEYTLERGLLKRQVSRRKKS